MSVRFKSYDGRRNSAATIHVFTALGGALGLLALISASGGHRQGTFARLAAALIVDGADGPLTRRLQVAETLPRFSGEDLDKVIGYLTYVTVPAFIVARGPLVPESLRLALSGFPGSAPVRVRFILTVAYIMALGFTAGAGDARNQR